MTQATFHVALIVFEIHVPYSHSLKEKRGALRGLKDTLKNQFNVSVSEVGYQDNWQRGQFACSSVSVDKKALQQLHSRIEQHILDHVDGELMYCDIELL